MGKSIGVQGVAAATIAVYDICVHFFQINMNFIKATYRHTFSINILSPRYINILSEYLDPSRHLNYPVQWVHSHLTMTEEQNRLFI